MNPEWADVYICKIISGFETLVINKVSYNENKEQMILDAVMMESHNYTEEEKEEVYILLKENDFNTFEDDFDITLLIEDIIPFDIKEISPNVFTLIKYPPV